jgi:hypothetical protein
MLMVAENINKDKRPVSIFNRFNENVYDSFCCQTPMAFDLELEDVNNFPRHHLYDMILFRDDLRPEYIVSCLDRLKGCLNDIYIGLISSDGEFHLKNNRIRYYVNKLSRRSLFNAIDEMKITKSPNNIKYPFVDLRENFA